MEDEWPGSLSKALDKAGITPEWVAQKEREVYTGHVYIIQCNEFYKIGCSRNGVEKRMAELQVGNPYKLELVMIIKTTHYPKTEKHLHTMLKKYRTRGEWFKLSQDQLDSLYNQLLDETTRQKLDSD